MILKPSLYNQKLKVKSLGLIVIKLTQKCIKATFGGTLNYASKIYAQNLITQQFIKFTKYIDYHSSDSSFSWTCRKVVGSTKFSLALRLSSFFFLKLLNRALLSKSILKLFVFACNRCAHQFSTDFNTRCLDFQRTGNRKCGSMEKIVPCLKFDNADSKRYKRAFS